ncbi:MAG: BirA family biotin operon repressor/biotin-[acetyl-CoA-carboxylase] ligase [Marivirga sp.]
MHKIFANTLFMGKQYISLPSCHSTNDIALQMAAEMLLYDGAVIHAFNQTNGRGQRGNKWQSEAGKNLTFTLMTKPKFLDSAAQFELNRIVSLAIADMLEAFLGDNKVSIKWPNDIYLGNKKVAGILIENTLIGRTIGKSIIGIGLNVNQKSELPQNATSMVISKGEKLDLLYVLDSLVGKLENYYLLLKSGNIDSIHEEYSHRLYQKGIVAKYSDEKGPFEGVLQGVALDGTLLIEAVNGQIKEYQFKEVQFL